MCLLSSLPPCSYPEASSHCTVISLFTVLSNNHPISALLLPPHLLTLLFSSSAPPSCPPHYGAVSVVTAVINQLILNDVEPCNPEHPPLLNQEVLYSAAVH